MPMIANRFLQVLARKNIKLWTPADMTTDLWLDASDASTITESGGAVSQWDDKSGNARHLTQATGSKQPAAVADYIEFAGTVQELVGAAYSSPSVTVLGVVQTYTNDLATDPNKSWLSTPGGGNPDFWMRAQTDSDTLGASIKVGATFDSVAVSAMRDNDHLVAFGSSDATSTMYVRIDGGAEEATGSEIGNIQQLSTELVMGRQKDTAGRFHEGRVYETIIIGNRLAIDSTALLKLEGYLAWKWGLTANLPMGHPYKDAPPYK